MTPKKKASELFDKINIHIPINASFNDSAEEASLKIEKDHLITKCIALIVADEVLNNYYKNHFQTGKKIDYWLGVKQEIENL